MPELGVDYLRVTHPCASGSPYYYNEPLDLHVLGTPPAFILSQDQTLHKNDFIVETFPRKAHSSWMWLCFQFSKSGDRFHFRLDFLPAGRGRENTNLIAFVQVLAQLFSRHTISPASWQARSCPRKGSQKYYVYLDFPSATPASGASQQEESQTAIALTLPAADCKFAARCARSSVDQSSRLRICRSGVRIPPGALPASF